MLEFDDKSKPRDPPKVPNYAEDTANAALLKAEKAQARIGALESEIDRHRRGVLALIVSVVVVVALCGAGTWWLHSKLTAQAAPLGRLPVLSATIDGLASRINAAETKISQLPDSMPSLMSRVDAIEKQMNAGLQSAKRQSTDAAAQMAVKLQNQLEQRFGTLDKRVAELQAQRQADAEQLAKLNGELTTLRSDVQNQIASVREGMPPDARPELAALREGMTRNGEVITAIANKLDRQRVDFEIPRNKEMEVSPGLFVSIENTNVEKQEIGGWLYVKDEHRTLWFQDHGLLKPITFYGSHDPAARELVITRVSSSGTVGYLLLPKEAKTAIADNR